MRRKHMILACLPACVIVAAVVLLLQQQPSARPSAGEFLPDSSSPATMPSAGGQREGATYAQSISGQAEPEVFPVADVERGIYGTVRDADGQPVEGARIVALWEMPDEFGDPVPLSSPGWHKLGADYAFLSRYRDRSLIQSAESKTARDGSYAVSGLPAYPVRLYAMHERFWLRMVDARRDQRVEGIAAGETVDWSASSLAPVTLQIEYPGARAPAGTQLSVRATSSRQRPDAIPALPARRTVTLWWLPGEYEIKLTNDAAFLESDWVTLQARVGEPPVTVVMNELPFAAFHVAFEGAAPVNRSHLVLTRAQSDDETADSEEVISRLASIEEIRQLHVYHGDDGLYRGADFVVRRSLTPGRYFVGFQCGAWISGVTRIDYEGGRQSFWIVAGPPPASEYGIVYSNASPPVLRETMSAEFMIGDHSNQASVWVREDGAFLIHARNPEAAGRYEQLRLRHSAWAEVQAQGAGRPGTESLVLFEPPARLTVRVQGLTPLLQRAAGVQITREGERIFSRSNVNQAVVSTKAGRVRVEVTLYTAPFDRVIAHDLELEAGKSTLLPVRVPELIPVKLKIPEDDANFEVGIYCAELDKTARINYRELRQFPVYYLRPGIYTLRYGPRGYTPTEFELRLQAQTTVDMTQRQLQLPD
jgi:hypothetical protein